MAELRLQMLGDFKVIRGDTVLELPPSKKTRGLLAYLALARRAMRREHLCELLWEIPDDPRGSLRWSLSKIRKLVDDQQCSRIIADRNTVTFDTSDVAIDVNQLYAIADEGSAGLNQEQLMRAVDHSQGTFLEGLELPNLHDFYIWSIGERERVARAQASLLQKLVSHSSADPEQAVVFSQRLVSLQPAQEPARAALITTLLQLDRKAEAQQQYRIGVAKLEELGIESTGALLRALRGPASNPGIKPAHTETPAPARPGPGPLVGRASELARLSQYVRQLGQGKQARLVLIRGEPGIGKSCLLRAVAAIAREAGAGLLKASAFESDMIRPFGVWNDALRRALPDNPTSTLLGCGEPVSRDAIFNSLCDVLQEACAHRPVVVLCDDMQWADESSVSAVNHVLRMNRKQPLLVIATSREIELRDNAALQRVLRSLRHDKLLDEICLEALSAEDIRELITTSAPGADAESLSKNCAGNPLLALELARAGLDGGSANSLAELVRDRLSRLQPDAETVLLWAAVVSPRIAVDSLQRVTGLAVETIETALEAAVQQGMLQPGERGLRFSHDLIASTIYAEIPSARRQHMHRRVAEQLEIETGVELSLAADLSHHARRSGDPALACRAMISAGKLCLRFYANDDALDLYRQGMGFAEQLGDAERVCASLLLCEIRLMSATKEDWEAEAEEYVQLAERAIDYGELPHARLGYQMASHVRWVHGEWREAKRFSLRAERVARGGAPEAQVLGLAEAAKCLALLEKDLSQADAMAMEASSRAQRIGMTSPAIPLSQGILRYYEDRLDDAEEHLEYARALSKSEGDRFNEFLANEYLTLLEFERGDFRAASDYAQSMVDIGSRLRAGSERPFADACKALSCYGQGQQHAELEGAIRELRSADAKQRLTVVLNRAAQLDIVNGCHQPALDRCQEALSLATTMDRPSEILQAHINLQLIHSANNSDVESQCEKIDSLLAMPVAKWARKRAGALLTPVEKN